MTRPNPFRGLMDLSGEMAHMRELGMTGYDQRYERYERTHADAWTPATDIFCKGADLFICLELGGLSRDDVEVTFSHGTLSVSGERLAGKDLPDDAFWQRERPYGTFRRTIGLPEHINEGDISATSQDGLLTVRITRACDTSGVTPRRIPIEGGSR